MRVIFLDLDGVLVNSWSLSREARAARPAGDSWAPFDAACVCQLNRITRQTGARLVMSSTWRVEVSLLEMRELLLNRGIAEPLMAFTPNLMPMTRGLEIQAWLDSVAHEVETFVILDDSDDMEHLLHRLVKTNADAGLTEAEASRAIEMLNTNRNPLDPKP